MESADPGSADELSASSLEDMLDAMDEPELPFEPPLPIAADEPELPCTGALAPEPVAAEVVGDEPLAAEATEAPVEVQPAAVDLDESDPLEVEPEEAEPAVARRSGLLAPVALAVVLVLLLGLVGWLVKDRQDARAREDARQAALQAARQEAVNLTSISYQTADADLGRIIDAATGTLKTQFEAQRAQFPGVLQRDKSVSVGTVLAAGVASQSASTVEALVAVDASVSNDQSAKTGGAIVKHYRMDMKLVHSGGRWLVSQVAFAGLPQ